MAFVAPLALAAGASAATATWVSVGVSVAMMVGSWLYFRSNQQKNEVFDPGAQEMPRFNQALRGATMPVLFGTNRVPSQIVWTKNFTTIRKETNSAGGGGKFGGSGFGSKTPAGGGEVTYEYKWDLIFHAGLTPEPYNLFGGWNASDRLNDSTILAISNGGEGLDDILFLSQTERPTNASLSFSEGFYSPGPRTGDSTFTPWAFFAAQEGAEHWFPNTAYIGFRQLSLGGQPAIPQLTWEIGPGEVSLTSDPQYRGSSAIDDEDHITTGSSILGDDGNRYIIESDNRIYSLTTGARQTITDSEADTLANDVNWNTPLVCSGSVAELVAIAGSDYFLCVVQDVGLGSNVGYYFVLCKINASGVPEAVGGYFAGGSSLSFNISSNCMVAASVANLQTEDDPVLVLWQGLSAANLRPVLCCLPSISDMSAVPAPTRTNTARMGEICALFDNPLDDYFFDGKSYYRLAPAKGTQTGWFLPDALGGTRLYVFVNKSTIQGHIDGLSAGQVSPFIDAQTGTYPDGFMAYVDMGVIAFPANGFNFGPTRTVVYCNDDFEEFPFEDAWTRADGTTDNDNDYYGMPTIHRLDDVAIVPVYLVIFTKRFQDEASLTPLTTHSRTVAYIYNQATGAFIKYGALSGPSFNTQTNFGAGANQKYTYTTTEIFNFYSPEQNALVEVRHVDSAAEANLAEKLVMSKFADVDIGGGGDVLPPYIIRQILTNTVFGLGYDTSIIHEASYSDVLDYCEQEGIRVSTMYLREEGALRIIELLLSLYGGFLVISGGQIKFGRQEVSDSVRTIDNHHLVRDGNNPPVKITRGAKQDAANKVKVNYIDRELEYRQNFIEVEDPVDIDINGVRAREFPPQFVMSEATARKLAIRALWAGLYARDQYQFILGPKDSDLEPGDVITLVDSFHPELSTGVYCRLVKWKEVKPGRYEVLGVTEYAEYNSSSLEINSSTQISSNALFGPARPPLDFRMYELPKEFQGADSMLYCGWVPGNFAMGARLYVSADNVSFAQVMDVQPYIIAGRLESDLGSHDGIDQSVYVHLFPASGFNVASPTYTMTHQLDDVSQGGRAIGAGLMWVGSEMMAYQGVTLLAQNYYRFDKVYRGWGGTAVHAHSIGDYWWKNGGGVFAQAYNQDKIGTTLYYKVSPYNFAGVEYDISSIDAKSYQILGTYHRPQNCPVIHTFVDTPSVGTSSEDLRGVSFKAVTSGGCNVAFDWSDSSRQEGFGQGGNGQNTYGHFAVDATSHQWRVQVSSSNGFVVRSVSVATHFYVYSRAVNSADFNGWKGGFTVRVTPWNNYGDALVGATKTLNLFG